LFANGAMASATICGDDMSALCPSLILDGLALRLKD
jgi:hypothetical protein